MPYALFPIPYSRCPMPYALCPMPYSLFQIVPDVTDNYSCYDTKLLKYVALLNRIDGSPYQSVNNYRVAVSPQS